jgi:hypothetical protein
VTARPAGVRRPAGFARVAAFALWLTAVGGGVAVIVVTLASLPFVKQDQTAALGLVIVILAVVALAYASTGLLIALRQPGNRIGWILLVAGLPLLATFAGFALAPIRALEAGHEDLLAGLLAWMGVVSFYPTFALFALLALLFPDGRLPSPRWKLPVATVVAAIVVGDLWQAVMPGSPDPTLARNPFGLAIDLDLATVVIGITTVVGSIGLLSLVAIAVAAVAIRFRRARGATRQQHKWFLAATTVSAALIFVTTFLGAAGWGLDDALGIGCLALLPIAIGMAILRYRLYEIDRLISRSLGWAIVSGVLLATFGAVLLALQAVLIGITQADTLAVAASTLLALALLQPVRRRVQSVVDRRFDRTRYDAGRIVDDFAGRLRDQFDLDLLARDVCRVAADAVRPVSVAVWLRHPGRTRP